MAAITTTQLTEADDLHCHYGGQYQQQTCHIELNLETGDLTAAYDPEIGGGIPRSVYCRRTLRWSIPSLTATAANTLLAEIEPIAQRVVDGATIEWNGVDHVGRLDADAATAADEIETLCDADRFGPEDLVTEWDAADYFGGGDREEAIEQMGLTADSGDEDLRRMAQEARDEAAACGQGYVVLAGIDEWLEDAREDLRQAVRDELEQVAEQLDTLISRRDELIVQLVSWGDSSRRIGELASLSHTRVQTIARTSAGDPEIMWDLETDATPQRLGGLASTILGRDAHPGTSDSGRLGAQLRGRLADLEPVRDALVGAGYQVILEPAR